MIQDLIDVFTLWLSSTVHFTTPVPSCNVNAHLKGYFAFQTKMHAGKVSARMHIMCLNGHASENVKCMGSVDAVMTGHVRGYERIDRIYKNHVNGEKGNYLHRNGVW